MNKDNACCLEVQPQNAARVFDSPAPILRKPAAKRLVGSAASVLEVGAGCLRNARFLLKQQLEVTVLEVEATPIRFPERYAAFKEEGGLLKLASISATTGTFHYPNSLKAGFDLALATFVIETICHPDERVALLRYVADHLSPSGALMLSVRGPRDVVTAHAAGRPCSDGFLTPQKTFIRPYTRSQLRGLLLGSGYSQAQFLHRKGVEAPELLHTIAFKEKRARE